MNCSPAWVKLMAAELQPAPALNCQSILPVLESYALKLPLPSPVKVSPPAVASDPPIIGWGTLFCQAILPVLRSTAENSPYCSSPGMATKAEPSHRRPFSHGAVC